MQIDIQVAAFADHANWRVRQTTVASASANGGLSTYSYVYTPSTNTAGTNSWQMKTTETQPSGTVDTVFTNYAGEVMLQAVSTGGQTWNTFAAFDPLGRISLTALPSAVTGYDPTRADLLNAAERQGAGAVARWDRVDAAEDAGSRSGPPKRQGSVIPLCLRRRP